MDEEYVNYDMVGNPIRPGDFIVRPYSWSRSACLTFSKVIYSDIKGIRVANVRPDIEYKRVQVDPEKSYMAESKGTVIGWETIKDGTIKNSERCMVIRVEDVPQEVIDLLTANI